MAGNLLYHSASTSPEFHEVTDFLNDEDEAEKNADEKVDSDSSCISTEIYASVVWHNGLLALSYYDLDTCQVYYVVDRPENDDFATLKQILLEIQPRVIILSSRQDSRLVTCLKKLISDNSSNRTENNETSSLEFLINSDFNYEVSKRRILTLNIPSIPKHFTEEEKKIYFSSLLSMERINLVRSIGGLLKYLDKSRVGVQLDDLETQVPVLGFSIHKIENQIQIDSITYSALSIFLTELHPSVFKNGTSSKEGLSLFGIINRCKSTNGTKKLRFWFLRPLTNAVILNARYDAISFFLKSENKETVSCLLGCLKNIKYISKVLLRMSKTQATLGDWISLFKTLRNAVSVKNICQNQPQNIAIFQEIGSSFIEDLNRCTHLISRTVDFQESKKCGRLVVLPNINEELDEKKRSYNGLTDIMNKVSQEELKSLRLDISKCCVSYLPRVGFLLVLEMPEGKTVRDDHTIEGLEFKFCTEKLIYYKTSKMAVLDKMLGDRLESIIDMETNIIYNLQSEILKQTQAILDVLDKISELDCLLVLASCAHEFGYVRPDLVLESAIDIKSGRHPLQELCCTPYVPNHTNMGGEESKIKLLTGPNACGKSVYLKQVALIVFMAHIGSFVPAESARIGPIDKIFTRIKSLESISEGMSTFLQDNMQMSEAVRSATASSLVVVDEYGKGTESTDGLALLTAVLKFWIDQGSSCPLVLVSTHFHSIIQQKLLPPTEQIQFLTLETLIQNDELVFLYQIKEGHTSSSFACNIAALVGMPPQVVKRGKEVSDLLSEYKSVPHMRDQNSKEQKLRHEKIVQEFLKLNLYNDDLQGFLSNFVLPMASTSRSAEKDRTVLKAPNFSKLTPSRHGHSKVLADHNSDVIEVQTKSNNTVLDDRARSSSKDGNVPNVEISTLKTVPSIAEPNSTDSAIELLGKFLKAPIKRNIVSTAVSDQGMKVTSDNYNGRDGKTIFNGNRIECQAGDKQVIKPLGNPERKFDFSFLTSKNVENQSGVKEASYNDREKAKSESRQPNEKQSAEKPRQFGETFTHVNRSSEKRTVDMNIFFQPPVKQQRPGLMASTPIKLGENVMSLAAIKKEKRGMMSYPSTCSGTMPENSSETSDYSQGQGHSSSDLSTNST